MFLFGYIHARTKKASAGGVSPPDPHQGALHPGPPRYLLRPPNDLP